MFQLIWNLHVNASILSAYVAEEHFDDCTENLDKYFAEALNLRGEISKVQQASIGSTTFSDEPCELFKSDPFITYMDDLEETLSDLVSPEHMDSLMASISSVARKSKGISADKLFKLSWLITEELADGAIDHNTQMCRHSADNIMSRQFSTNDRMLRYRRIQSAFFSDTMFATPKAKSTRGHSCCQVFVSDKGFVAVYPMKSQEEFQTALHWFCKQIGVPISLIVDAHKAQTSNKV